ncbi:uncharacterized protein LOC143253137 [Tachypleus tridentatus]|uniref:uncharacterized protein LOC143253137 n=1 Tax=Tachypleus tridentatus TaxID=6853 RepID=UPI003FD62F62
MTLRAPGLHILQVNVLLRVCSTHHLMVTDVFKIRKFLTGLLIVLHIFGYVTGHPVEREPNDVLVSEQPFAPNLRNPCSGYSFTLEQGSAQVDYAEMLKSVQKRVSSLNNVTKEMRRSNLVIECSDQFVHDVYEIPNVNRLKDLQTSQAMQLLDELVVNYTAYVYFLKYQQQSSGISCYVNKTNDLSFVERAQIVVVHLQDVRCFLKVASQVRGHEIDINSSTNKILNESFKDWKACSRREFRDCQLIDSVLSLSDVLFEYLNSQISSAEG